MGPTAMLGVIVVLVVFAVLALLLGFSRWLAGRPWAAAGNVAVAVVLVLVAHRFWPAVVNLDTYETMPANAMVAQVYSERTGPRAYRVTVTRLPSGRMQVFEVSGDEWQLDARTLGWTARAARLGLQPGYRFERLSARYRRATDAADAGTPPASPPSSFGLSDGDEIGEDVWAQARTGTRWENDARPSHAQSPWRPLAHEARYDLWLSRGSGGSVPTLDARPANEAAEKAMLYTRANNNVRTQG